jgi:serine/threonine-protein kinase HipA
MGRPSKARSLAVWMNGEFVGEWRLASGRDQEFLYAESWLEFRDARPISLSLPLRPSREPYRGPVVEAFFENLLPDNRQIRERIQRRFHAGSMAAFDLLREVGRDCVGALQLLAEGEKAPDVRVVSSERLTVDDVERLLAVSSGSDIGQEEDLGEGFRISLAGAQEKTALLWRDGAWHRPTGTTPTTHIIKLPMGVSPSSIDLSTSVENEWLCAQIAREYGVPVAPCHIERFGRYKTLVVDRFDRKLAVDGSWWMRLPQEDFCQATGTSPSLKYENDGGPGIRMIMETLLGSQNAEEDRRDFLRTQFLFWLLAAIDGHAKNFSLFLLPGGAYRLTPRYDILSAHPVLGHGSGKLAPQRIKMAMAVEGKSRHYRWADIRAHHWIETAKKCGVADMKRTVDEIVEQTPMVVDRVRSVLPDEFPAQIADAILGGVIETSERAKREFLEEG